MNTWRWCKFVTQPFQANCPSISIHNNNITIFPPGLNFHFDSFNLKSTSYSPTRCGKQIFLSLSRIFSYSLFLSRGEDGSIVHIPTKPECPRRRTRGRSSLRSKPDQHHLPPRFRTRRIRQRSVLFLLHNVFSSLTFHPFGC